MTELTDLIANNGAYGLLAAFVAAIWAWDKIVEIFLGFIVYSLSSRRERKHQLQELNYLRARIHAEKQLHIDEEK
jgi:hypothetical protein